MYVFLGQFCLCRPYCGGQVGEWVCTLWVSCHFETCGITLWQPYLAAIHCTLLRCWLAKRGRRPISLYHSSTLRRICKQLFPFALPFTSGYMCWNLEPGDKHPVIKQTSAGPLSSSKPPTKERGLTGWSGWWKMWVRVCIWGWQWIGGCSRGPQMDLGGPCIFCPAALIQGSPQMRQQGMVWQENTFRRYLW